MLRVCPHHGLEKWLIIYAFFNGLLYKTRMTIDPAASGTLMNKPFDDAYALIESMTQNHCQWGRECAHVKKTQPKGG